MRPTIIIALMVAGCSTFDRAETQQADYLTDLPTALGLWANSDPPDYRYGIQWLDSSGCASEELIVTVINHDVESSRAGKRSDSCYQPRSSNGLTGFTEFERDNTSPTISNLLANLATTSVSASLSSTGAVPVDAHFNSDYGFPLQVTYRYSAIHTSLSQRDYGYRITRFELR